MKKIFIAILALVALPYAATYSKQLFGNVGQSLPLFSASPNGEPVMGAVVNLDTLEADTGKYYYDLVGKPIISSLDTVGYVHFTCKDSTGTDTLAVRLYWQGNMRSDGVGTWAMIDSVTLKDLAASGAAGQGVYTNATPTPVVNSKGYMSLRFIAKNILNGNANRKSACKDFVINRRQRLSNIAAN